MCRLAVIFLVVLLPYVCPLDSDPPDGTKGKIVEELKTLRQKFMEGWYTITYSFLDRMDADLSKIAEATAELYNASRGGNIRKEDIQKYANEITAVNSGFIACLFFGFLYVVVMFFALILLPACRCCCLQCGGRRTQVIAKNTGKWRVVNVVILVVIIGVLVTSSISMIVSSIAIINALDVAPNAIVNVSTAVIDYTDTLSSELTGIANHPLENVVKNLSDQMDSIKNKSENDILNVTGLDKLEKQGGNLNTFINQSNEFNRLLNELGPKFKDAEEERKQIENLCSREQIDCSKIEVPSDSSIPKLDSSRAEEAQNILKNVETEVDKMREEFNRTYGQFRNELDDEVKVKEQDIRQVVTDVNSSLVRVTHDLREFVFNHSNNPKAKAFFYHWHNFSKVMWGSIFGIALIPTLMTVGLILGLVCGTCGHSSDREPDERKSLSRTGGNCLLLSIYFFLPFAAILMLITMVLFLSGGFGYLYGCKYVKTDRLKEIDRLMETIQKTTGQERDKILMYIRPGHIVQTCKENEPLINAIDASQFNLQDLEQLQEEVNRTINENKEKIDIKLNYDEMKRQMTALDGPVQKIQELQEVVEKANNDTATVREKLENALKNEGNVQKKIEKLGPEDKKKFEKYFRTLHAIKEILDNLSISLETAKNAVNQLSTDLKKTVDEVQANLNAGIEEKVKGIVQENLDTFTFNVTDIKKTMFGEVGRCRQMYEAFMGVAYFGCDLIMDPFNGYWAGLGTSLFFYIPALIVAMKLSKHYLKVKPIYTIHGYVEYAKL